MQIVPVIYYTLWQFVHEQKLGYTYIHLNEFTAASVVSLTVN